MTSGRNCVRKYCVNVRITRCATAPLSTQLRSVVQAAFGVPLGLVVGVAVGVGVGDGAAVVGAGVGVRVAVAVAGAVVGVAVVGAWVTRTVSGPQAAARTQVSRNSAVGRPRSRSICRN